jgi:hypothetical protein
MDAQYCSNRGSRLGAATANPFNEQAQVMVAEPRLDGRVPPLSGPAALALSTNTRKTGRVLAAEMSVPSVSWRLRTAPFALLMARIGVNIPTTATISWREKRTSECAVRISVLLITNPAMR